ncbi:hypothetical protein MMC09_004871 [Bachmanniomyces sp. S44760]|nr:hypothetical protein [Bachmanniomyces sp. S44760]
MGNPNIHSAVGSAWFAHLIADQAWSRELYNFARVSRAYWWAVSPRLFREVEWDVMPDRESGEVDVRKMVTQTKRLRLFWATHTWDSEKAIFVDRCLDRLEELIIDLDWNQFCRPELLYVLGRGSNSHSLKKLDAPIGKIETCHALATALTRLPELKSLRLRSMPDDAEFMQSALPKIGYAIRKCLPALEALDLEMTNANRPQSWDVEKFVWPKEDHAHFRMLFPFGEDVTLEQMRKERMQGREDDSDSERPRMKLRSLRLRNFNIPDHTFETVFDPVYLQALDIQGCVLGDGIWRSLEESTRLLTLKNVNDNLLSQYFLRFLKQQRSLKVLTFSTADPTIWEYSGGPWYCGGSKICCVEDTGREITRPDPAFFSKIVDCATRLLPSLRHLELTGKVLCDLSESIEDQVEQFRSDATKCFPKAC